MPSPQGVTRVPESSDEILGAPILYREWGYFLSRGENYLEAIKAFETSRSHAEYDDLGTLLGLSVALSRSTKYAEAADVIDKCMEIDPENSRVKWRRVETLFDIAEFGYSLVHAHQGMQRHEFPFELGVFQGNETVEDCIGRNTSPKILWELYPWIRDVQRRERELIDKLDREEDEFEGIEDENSRFKVNDPEAKLALYLSQLNRVQASTYLGLLALDEHAMKEIMKTEALRSANPKSSDLLRQLAETSYAKSRYRQQVLRMRRPFYAYRYQREQLSPGRRVAITIEKNIRRNNLVVAANSMLMRLHEARINRDYVFFFNCLERARVKFEGWKDKQFPVKSKCLEAINEMCAWAYSDSRNLSGLREEAKEVHLKHHLGIRVGELPRDTDIGWLPTRDKKHSLRVFRRRLALASSPLSRTWLLHDLAKLFLETRRHELARFYAKKARDASVEAKDERWTLNANHLLIRVELSQRNRNEAREAAQLALIAAERLGIDYLIEFYRKAIRLVDLLDLDLLNTNDGIAKRERLVLDLMPPDMIDRVAFLFRSMNAVPAKRRFSIMPGCKPVDREFKVSCKRNTILLAPPRSPEKEARRAVLEHFSPNNRILGWMDFEEYE